MKEKPRTLRATVSGVTLFSDDIRALAGMLSRRLGEVHIETDRFERASGAEFFEKSIETRPLDMELTDSNGLFPNFRLRLGRFGTEIVAKGAREADALALEVTRYLRAPQSWLARYWATPAAQWITILLVAAWASLVVWLRAPEWLWPGMAGSVAFAALLNAWVGMMAVSERHARTVVVMDKTRKEARFWQRNRDLSLVLLAGAFTLAAAALQVYLPK